MKKSDELINIKKSINGPSLGWEFLDYASDIIQSVDSKGKLVYVNKAWLKTLGYTLSEALQLSFLDIIDKDHKDYCLKKFQASGKDNNVVSSIETVFVSKEGRKILVDGWVSTHSSSGKSFETIGIFRDIAGSGHEDEELRKLAKIYEQSPNPIILTGSNGLIEYVNPRFCSVSGYTLEEVKGKNPRMISSGQTDIAVYKGLWSTILSKNTWVGELLNKKKNGELYWAKVSISPILNDAGEIVNFIGIQEDITLNKKSEAELRLFSKTAVERELKMIELKKEVNTLLLKLQLKEKYHVG